MNHLSLLLLFFLLSRLFRHNDSNETTRENTGIQCPKKLVYYSNGALINETLSNYYLKVLDLDKTSNIDKKIIFKSYTNHLSYINEDIILGYKVKFSKEDMKLSHDYLCDLCDYYSSLN